MDILANHKTDGAPFAAQLTILGFMYNIIMCLNIATRLKISRKNVRWNLNVNKIEDVVSSFPGYLWCFRCGRGAGRASRRGPSFVYCFRAADGATRPMYYSTRAATRAAPQILSDVSNYILSWPTFPCHDYFDYRRSQRLALRQYASHSQIDDYFYTNTNPVFWPANVRVRSGRISLLSKGFRKFLFINLHCSGTNVMR